MVTDVRNAGGHLAANESDKRWLSAQPRNHPAPWPDREVGRMVVAQCLTLNRFLRLEEDLKVVDEGRDGGSGFAIDR